MNPQILHSDADIAKAARCLKAMSQLFSVQDIVEQVGTSQSNISQHLSILRDKHILGCKKEANRVYYFIDDRRVSQLIHMMQDVFCSKKH
jgi:ArsR family transcriptional regulator